MKRRANSLESFMSTKYSDDSQENLIQPPSFVNNTLNKLTREQKQILKNNFLLNCDLAISRIDVFELYNKILRDEDYDIAQVILLVNATLKKLLFKSINHEIIELLSSTLNHLKVPKMKHDKLALLHIIVFLSNIDYSSHSDLDCMYC
jgi:hypothetical protein